MTIGHRPIERTKKPYAAPRLTVYGDVARITLGPNLGLADFIIGVVTTGTPGNGGFYCPGESYPQLQPCS